MHIPKKQKWKISFQVRENISNSEKIEMRLSFTVNDYLTFVPPNEPSTNFNIYTSIHSDILALHFPKLKPGVYKNTHACCLIIPNPQGICLHGASHRWENLKELLAMLLSSAGMYSKSTNEKNVLAHNLMIEWTETLLALPKS